MSVSIVIRTYNEDKHLPELLTRIGEQELDGRKLETILVDSGSTDNTLSIAESHNCKIVHIDKSEFTFGRSLNMGCSAATGNILVFISGHCIPIENKWLIELVKPIEDEKADYSYGQQCGNGDSKFSECQLFKKYYPDTSQIPQEGFFCNNANAALKRETWDTHKFDEELTGLEDMALARRLVHDGLKIAYTASAGVYHIHEETWSNIKNRYEREAIALQRIMPEVHLGWSDFLRYFTSAVLLDSGAALQQTGLRREIREIILFRLMQFWGSYRGNQRHRELSKQTRERYFYPK